MGEEVEFHLKISGKIREFFPVILGTTLLHCCCVVAIVMF